jgi:hypothetical protein
MIDGASAPLTGISNHQLQLRAAHIIYRVGTPVVELVAIAARFVESLLGARPSAGDERIIRQVVREEKQREALVELQLKSQL